MEVFGQEAGRTRHVVYYVDEKGREPARDFIEGIRPPAHRAKVKAWIGVLEEKTVSLREPFVKSMGEGIWELRIRHGRTWYRIFYFYHQKGAIVMMNGFQKVTAKTPPEEIERAKRAKQDVERNGIRTSRGKEKG